MTFLTYGCRQIEGGTFLVLSLALVVACGGKNQPCLDYTNAVQDCVDAAEAEGLDEFDMDMSDPEGFCDEFGDDETDEGWACLTDT